MSETANPNGTPDANDADQRSNRAMTALTPDTVQRLIELETLLLRRLQLLQAAESRLSKLTRRLRAGAGRRAARQIERERQRLGRELHTGVGQLLAAIRIQLEVLNNQLPVIPPAAAQTLQRIGDLAGQALDQVRGVAHRLHPPEWQRLPLDAALQQLWVGSGVPERFRGVIRTEPLSSDLDPELKALFYRAAQEALANIFRHAQASRIDLILSTADGRLTLSIADDGVGFDAPRVLAGATGDGAGLGIRSLREQAADLGARLAIHSGPHGTTLELSSPAEV